MTPITIYVLSPTAQFAVPKLVGDTTNQAAAVLVQSGLTLGATTATACSNSVPIGLVVSSTPAQGTLSMPVIRSRSSTSTGYCKVQVPSVIDESQAQAMPTLRRRPLLGKVSPTDPSTCSPSQVGTVSSREPRHRHLRALQLGDHDLGLRGVHGNDATTTTTTTRSELVHVALGPMAKSTSKPGSRKNVGRYVAPEARGKVTARRPVGEDHSPRWYGWLIVALLGLGMLTDHLELPVGPARLGVLVVPHRWTRRDVRRFLPGDALQVAPPLSPVAR